MPTYGYECKSCGHTFDAFQSMKDEPLKICPECGKEIRRLINGGTGIIFRGGGFYVTDNGGKGSKSGGSSRESSKTADAKPAGTDTAACQGCPAGGGAKPDSCPKASASQAKG